MIYAENVIRRAIYHVCMLYVVNAIRRAIYLIFHVICSKCHTPGHIPCVCILYVVNVIHRAYIVCSCYM
ncbi:predicted protein [Nematostella vectensis]|uniref:Uncharacterized protein n=1 Tax=Nematostella vectensis TaxID=45351 RepID=A7S9C2_NEMVE|nr:predicted protein [Nematostella vectensis]|eukprot:XP_001631742.1 predicted protein [Nematostella vectensis]